MRSLGIDIGTTSISMVLLDEDTGALVARETVNHAAFIDDGCAVGKVQDAGRIVAIALEKYASLVAAHGRPCCIGLTGQMHGMLYVDEDGKAVSPLYTWQDGRGNLPMGDGQTYAQALRRYGAAAAGYGLTTHFYMVKNGLVPKDAASMTTISDYLAMKLTGNRSPVLGADMAASWGCFDLERKVFRVADPLLPKVVGGYEIVGETPEGVPVTVSAGDNQASVLGSVKDLTDTVLINIGTGSQVSLGTDRWVECGGAIELRPCGGDGYILAGSGLCGGRAYAMLEQFYREAAGTDAPCYDRMLEQAEAFVARYGMDAAWRVRTTFSGTRSDPGARGSIEGIGVENFRPGALTAGLVAGILSELNGFCREMTALTGARPAALVGSGNGLRRNPLMRRLAEEMFGMPLQIPAHMEEAAYGAALCALWASGRVKSLRDAQRMIRYIGG